MKVRSVVFYRKACGVLGLKVCGAMFAFFLQAMLARKLGVEQYGVYSYLLSWVAIMAITSSFGFEHVNSKNVAVLKVKNKNERLVVLVFTSYICVLFVSLVCLALLTLFSNKLINVDVYKSAFLACLFLIPLQAFIHVNIGILRGFKSQMLSVLLSDVGRPVLGCFLVYLIFQLFNDFSAATAIRLMACASLVVLSVGFYSVYRYVKRIWVQPPWLKVFGSVIVWGKYAIPFVLYTGVTQVERNIDILMLGRLDSLESVGIFSVVSRITTLILLINVALGTVASPIFSELKATNKLNELQLYIKYVVVATTVIAIIIAGICLKFGETILLFFGEEYIAGYATLKIICIAQVVKAVAGPVLVLSVATGRQNVLLMFSVVTLVVHALLNLVLIPIYGSIGCAYAILISILVLSFGMAAHYHYKDGLNTTILSVFLKK